MSNLLSTLPKLSFRGIVLPYQDRSSGFSHESAEQRYVFRDEGLIQSLGKKNTTIRFTVPFLEGIIYSAAQPFNKNGEIFSTTYFDCLTACKNREVGDLIDPVLGLIPAKVVSFSDKMTPANQDGVIAEIEFIHCPTVEDDIAPPWVRAGTAVAVANLDDALGRAEWKQQEPPKAYLDPFQQLQSIAGSSAIATQRVTGQVDKLLFNVQKTENSFTELKSTRNAEVRRLNDQFKRTLIETRRTAGSLGQSVKEIWTPKETTIGQLAQLLNITQAELCRMNPDIVRHPTVPANSKIKYPGK